MHPLTTRAGRVAMVLAAVAATVGILALDGEPAVAADGSPCAGCSHQGNRTGMGYSAAAAFVTATHGGSASSDNSCEIEVGGGDPDAGGSGIPAPPVHPEQGHYEIHSYPRADGTYDVFLDCIENGHTGIDDPGLLWNVVDLWEGVPALDPVELVEEALANMPVGSPRIQTSPGEGNPSMVGIETWLMIDEATFTRGSRTDTQGPISVTVWAEPDPNGEVVWDTGEGRETCVGSGHPEGSCSHTYESSSLGQGGADAAGRPSYAITASVSYTGGYAVTAFGSPVGGDPDLGDITRTSEPYFLAVEEAQALNDGH